MNSFIYIKPMKRFKYGSDVMKLRSFSDGTSGRIENKLKTIYFSVWKIEQKRVTVVKFRMNKRGDYGTRCGAINGVSDAPEISNVIQA